MSVARVSIGGLIVVMVCLVAGCAGLHNSGGENEAGDITRTPAPSVRKIRLEIPRPKLITALQQEVLIDRLRVVEMYSSHDGVRFPLYHLFDVHPKSVFALLGLQNADVLVAANERYLKNKDVFKQYVRLLRDEKEAEIEIIRSAEPILYQYKFVD